MDDEEIRTIVDEVIRNRLGTANIADVKARWDEDELDDVIDVIVTLESAEHEFEPARLSSLVRHVRSALTKRDHEKVFPLITFVSKEEAGEALACG